MAGNKPGDAVDRCFNTDGSEYARGDNVWNGILDDQAAGKCTKLFPLHSTSRIVAGGPIEGGVFKCSLQSVEEATAKGLYGDVVPSTFTAQLENTLPSGVCDYGKPDQGRPIG